MSTIYAVSSGTPPAAIAILRLSGAAAFDTVRALAGSLPAPRSAGLRALHDPDDGNLLDRALVLLFPGPASATGEDVAELHLHGGRATVRAVEAVLARMPGLRAAEPGEFTRRALMNGRIDLSEAEGLGDLLMAETEAQRRTAMLSAEGGVRTRVERWTARTLALAARIELLLDHADEEDAGDEAAALAEVRGDLEVLVAELDEQLAVPPSERLRDGIRVTLAGPPNAGKSTLFNVLVGRDAAIVSSIAGTTRDRIEAPVVRNGTAWLFIDTAGLNDGEADAIEQVGIARSHVAMAEADVVLWLGDDPPPDLDARIISVHARADLSGRGAVPDGRVRVVAAQGEVQPVWAALTDIAATLLPRPDVVALNRRQRGQIGDAADHLRSAAHEQDPLLVAEALRGSRNALHRITGRADVEAMLDALFGNFCIGK